MGGFFRKMADGVISILVWTFELVIGILGMMLGVVASIAISVAVLIAVIELLPSQIQSTVYIGVFNTTVVQDVKGVKTDDTLYTETWVTDSTGEKVNALKLDQDYICHVRVKKPDGTLLQDAAIDFRGADAMPCAFTSASASLTETVMPANVICKTVVGKKYLTPRAIRFYFLSRGVAAAR